MDGGMRAMVLTEVGQPLAWQEHACPMPGPGEVRLRVLACGVCRTDLHVVDGDLPQAVLPIVPGHEIVGEVDALGPGAQRLGLAIGDRVGVGWLGGTCGHCPYCVAGQENLCDAPEFTGFTRGGGFASHVVARAAFCIPLPGGGDPIRTAPLLCAGLVGWRALKASSLARTLGLYGFGAAAHLVAQLARAQGRRVFAFTRPGDEATQAFALSVGADWAGGSLEPPPQPLDAAIVFAPDGALVPVALEAVRKGGTVVCGGIHMSDIPAFPYRLLWNERRVVSIANLTRADAREFASVVRAHPPAVHATEYPLARANDALADLRAGRFHGAAVLRC